MKKIQPEILASVTYKITEPLNNPWRRNEHQMFISEMLQGESFRIRRLGQHRLVEFTGNVDKIVEMKVREVLRNFSALLYREGEDPDPEVRNSLQKIRNELRKKFNKTIKLPNGALLDFVSLEFDGLTYP